MTTMKKAGLRQTLALAIGSIPREGSWVRGRAAPRGGSCTRRVGPVAGRHWLAHDKGRVCFLPIYGRKAARSSPKAACSPVRLSPVHLRLLSVHLAHDTSFCPRESIRVCVSMFVGVFSIVCVSFIFLPIDEPSTYLCFICR